MPDNLTRDQRKDMKRCPLCGMRRVISTASTYLPHGPGAFGALMCRMSGKPVQS